jgi:hypothetical protein
MGRFTGVFDDETPTAPSKFAGVFDDEPAASEMSWGEVGEQALKNAPSSAFNNMLGIAQQLASPGGQAGFGMELATDPETRKGTIEHFTNYLSVPGIKKNIAENPVGVGIDVASLVTPMKVARVASGGAAAAPKILSTAELKAAGGAGLNVAKDSGVFFMEDFVKPLQTTIVDVAKRRNFRPGRRGTGELEDIMKDVTAMSERPWSFSDMQTLGRDLNDAWRVAKKAGYEDIAGIAGEMRATVNKFLDNVSNAKGEGLYAAGDLTPEQAAHIFQESNKIYRQAKVGQKLETIGKLSEIDSTQFVQSGQANALRKYARQTLREHAKGKPTGLNASEIKTLEDFNKGRLSDWALKNINRYAGGVMGAILGGTAGGPIGSAVAMGIGAGAKGLGDRLAVQRFNRFIESVRAEGSSRLEGLLDQTVHEHVAGTPRGKTVIRRWTESIGTNAVKAASKSLAAVVAQTVKQPSLAPRIEQELMKIVEELQGSAESQAEQQ